MNPADPPPTRGEVSGIIACIGNLGCERAWSGVGPLPQRVRRHIAGLSTLMRALVDTPRVVLVADDDVDLSRLPPIAGLPEVQLATAPPCGVARLAWGAFDDVGVAGEVATVLGPIAAHTPPRSIARAVSDRRWALSVARDLGLALDGKAAVHSFEEVGHAVGVAAAVSPTQRWVAKAPWTAAGRDRVWGSGPNPDPPTAARLRRLLEGFGAVIIEPWLARRSDVGVMGTIAPDRSVNLFPPHRLLCNERGGFVGIDVDSDGLSPLLRAQFLTVAHVVGMRLAAAGVSGPFGIDGFTASAADGEEFFVPLVEINPRLTFAAVAWALAKRLGRPQLRLGPTPPTSALVLLSATAADPVAAWLI